MAAKEEKTRVAKLATLDKRYADQKRKLVDIEKQIYDLETSYLEETAQYGGSLRGWENYLKK
jgi:hypothetical protein